MAVNSYDQAALALFINTYVPINFGELYRVGAAQRLVVEDAAQLFGSQLQKFGEFKSPSSVDTQRYYDLTTGRLDFQEAINQMVANPDAMKDAGFRSGLQSLINSVDYSTLSRLRQSSENLDARQRMIAQMRAAGKYNEQWDDINIDRWDTSGMGIMTDLAPIEFMTANQLSNPYFDNLKSSSLGATFKDGVKYQQSGITYDNLKGIATARFNDLINTPQGRKYYDQALRQADGDAAKAQEAFTTMIANSQMDRIVNNIEVDPVWLAMAKQRMSRAGEPKVVQTMPTRLDFLNDTVVKASTRGLGSNFQQGYQDYLVDIANKYPGTKIQRDALKGLQNLDRFSKATQAQQLNYQFYANRYNATGNPEDLNQATIAAQKASSYQNQMIGMGSSYIMRNEFERVAGFSPVASKTNPNYSNSGYLRGVNSALDLVKGSVGVTDNDALLTASGGRPTKIVDDNGTEKNAFTFNSSKDFILPETAFNLMASTSNNKITPRNIKRASGIFRSGDFPLRELIEGNKLNSVQFVPDNEIIKIGDNFATSGKLRIPKSELTKHISTGILQSRGALRGLESIPGVQSINSAINDLFGGGKVTEKIGEDGKEFYELDTYKVLPREDVSSEYWQRVNQEWQGSDSGIGGATQAKETYYDSAEQNLR